MFFPFKKPIVWHTVLETTQASLCVTPHNLIRGKCVMKCMHLYCMNFHFLALYLQCKSKENCKPNTSLQSDYIQERRKLQMRFILRLIHLERVLFVCTMPRSHSPSENAKAVPDCTLSFHACLFSSFSLIPSLSIQALNPIEVFIIMIKMMLC